MSIDTSSWIEQDRFPDSDGEPISDNTRQAKWIVMMFDNINALYQDRPDDVFVAMDHLIYLDANEPKHRIAPDVYVAYGRPKHHRGSYKLWLENNIFPQVVIEILSPKNSRKDMARKRATYEQQGCEEYIEIEPDTERLEVWVRGRGKRKLRPVVVTPEWTSPRLGARFVPSKDSLTIYHANGRPFRTYEEVTASEARVESLLNLEQSRADAEKLRADAEKSRADAEKLRADTEKSLAGQYRAKLIGLGIDPDTLNPLQP